MCALFECMVGLSEAICAWWNQFRTHAVHNTIIIAIIVISNLKRICICVCSVYIQHFWQFKLRKCANEQCNIFGPLFNYTVHIYMTTPLAILIFWILKCTKEICLYFFFARSLQVNLKITILFANRSHSIVFAKVISSHINASTEYQG